MFNRILEFMSEIGYVSILKTPYGVDNGVNKINLTNHNSSIF